MRNKAPEISASRSLVPARRTGTVATALATIMSMSAASSAQAQSAAAGFIVVQKVGSGGSGVDKTARASAEAANKAVEAALKRLEASETIVAAALKAFTAATDALTAAVSKQKDLEARLAVLETAAKRSGDAPSSTPPSTSKDKDKDLPGGTTPTGDKADDKRDGTKGKGGDTDGSTPPAARELSDEEIIERAAAARSRLEIKAALANAARVAAEAEVQARRTQEALMRAQVQKTQAAADLAQAIADQKAAKLAEAQAASNAANAQAAGLNGQARVANLALDAARNGLRDAEDRSSKAAQDAQAANGVLARLNGGVSGGGVTGASRLSVPRAPYAPVSYGGETPQFFGEVVGNIGLNLSSGSDFRGGIGAAGFARLGEQVAAGVRGEVGGGTRLVRMEGEQNVLGSSSDASIMGALQLGTIGGENGVNVEVAGGVMRESQMGVAYGANGSERSGVANVSPKFSATLAGYILVSPEIRLKVKCGLDLILGRPTQLGSDVRENAVGIGLGFGISTK